MRLLQNIEYAVDNGLERWSSDWSFDEELVTPLHENQPRYWAPNLDDLGHMRSGFNFVFEKLHGRYILAGLVVYDRINPKCIINERRRGCKIKLRDCETWFSKRRGIS
jgi:hypothetical protein